VNPTQMLTYNSCMGIMLLYDFTLWHNAPILSIIVIASYSYRSEHREPVFASYSYRFDVIDKRYRIYSLSLLGKIAYKSYYNKILFCDLQQNYSRK
jgi:hypothetical protein